MNGASSHDISLSALATLTPQQIISFVSALALREPWALAVVEARAFDGPFDRLATYWTVSSPMVRRSISSGLLFYFDEHGPSDNSNRAADDPAGIDDALAFCIRMFPDLDVDLAIRFFPHIRFWLRNGGASQKKLAAAAFASVSAVEALSVLEGEAAASNYPQWILPALIERRTRCDPFLLFSKSEHWLADAVGNIASMAALQNGIKRMAGQSAPETVVALKAVFGSADQTVREAIWELIDELPIAEWPSLNKLRGADQPESAVNALASPPTGPIGHEDLFKILGEIRRESIGDKAKPEVTQKWTALLERMATPPGEMERIWQHVRLYAGDVARTSTDDGFLASLRPALVGNSTKWPDDPIVMLREIQHEFYHTRMAQHGDASKSLQIIRERLVEVKPVKSRAIPPKHIRIPSVIYAEEAYMEVLRFLLKANFPKLEIEEIQDIPWGGLDEALARSEERRVGKEC